MSIDASVIICAYTEARWDDLRAAVSSVQRQSVAPIETIVVIDHNPRLLQRAQADIPGVTLLENQETRGLSGARNTGVKAAHGALARVTEAIETLHFNVAIAHIYEFANALGSALANTAKAPDVAFAIREAADILVRLFNPMMPHLAEE